MAFIRLTKEQAKEEVKILVEKYIRIVDSGRLKSYNEEMTKKEFIEPLFESLGWDIRNTRNDDEVLMEEKVSKGRVDYSFRIGGIPKFFLEAKALKEDLDNLKFIEQTVNYSWHKGCTWAVLTDFEAIKIFNAEWKSVNPLQAQFGQTLPCQLFIEKFDILWLLSRESFEKKLLDIEAEKWGKKVKKIPVDKQLLDDLTKFRDLLNKNIIKNNTAKNLSGDDLDEAVQRIIDRLIFIRTLEDKELEAPVLQSIVREDLNKRVHKKLTSIFRKIDDIYNSKLFTPHLCEELEIDDDVLSKIVNGLFNTSDNAVHYDFSAIDADVLGNIYEQYLGHILKKTDKRAQLTEGKTHRKEQGIFYTPTYVVDYIIKNTVGELAKDKKFDLEHIKVLDPACGSGSFLMKSFDYLVTLDKKKNEKFDQTKLDLTGASATYGRKIEILKNNIFGVDLDAKAVEIAQLNLLLKAAEKKHRLPTLQENIRVGNSLIDDSDVEGNKAFKWEEKFKDIMQNGGFDVVVGNPPYISIERGFIKTEIGYLTENYMLERIYDTFALFIEKGLRLLKDDGYLGFIIPSTLLQNLSFAKIREFILKNYHLNKVIFCGDGVFGSATVPTCIIIVRKCKKSKDTLIYSRDGLFLEDKPKKIMQSEFLTNTYSEINISHNNFSEIIKQIEKNSTNLSDFLNIKEGVKTGNDKEFIFETKNEGLKPLVKGRDVGRYSIVQTRYILYDVVKLNRPQTSKLFEEVPKMFIRRVGADLVGAIDENGIYCVHTLYVGKLINKDVNIYYLLALINSKLLNFYKSNKWPKKGDVFPEIRIYQLNGLPIKLCSDKTDMSSVISKAKELQILNNFLLTKNKKTDEYENILHKINQIDLELDKLVCRIYGVDYDLLIKSSE